MIMKYRPMNSCVINENWAKVFDDLFADSAPTARQWLPAVDVLESEKEFTLVAELPGLEQDQIEVEMTGDVLTIRGNRATESEESTEKFVRRERAFGTFTRSFTLNVPVDSDSIAAAFKNGVLTVRVPKTPEPGAKRIAIDVS